MDDFIPFILSTVYFYVPYEIILLCSESELRTLYFFYEFDIWKTWNYHKFILTHNSISFGDVRIWPNVASVVLKKIRGQIWRKSMVNRHRTERKGSLHNRSGQICPFSLRATFQRDLEEGDYFFSKLYNII